MVFSCINNNSVKIKNKCFQIKNLFPTSLRDSISGTSSTTIQVAVPSLIRGQDIKKSYLELSSNLNGTEMNFPDPFFKSKEDSADLNILFYPAYSNEYSRLQFKLGDIIYWKGHVAICINSNKLIHAYGPKKKVLVMDINKTISLIKKTANLEVKKIFRI